MTRQREHFSNKHFVCEWIDAGGSCQEDAEYDIKGSRYCSRHYWILRTKRSKNHDGKKNKAAYRQNG